MMTTMMTMMMKDKLDILRDKSAKAEKMESVVETYKRKLEDAADVKRQVMMMVMIDDWLLMMPMMIDDDDWWWWLMMMIDDDDWW